jgi:murein DD-endopeptidase MepM/ murein hydrolase activator NlpD
VQHTTHSGQTFFALYGHIKTDTLPAVGTHVLAGHVIARVGHYWYQSGRDVSHVHSGIMPDRLPANPWQGYTLKDSDKHTNHYGFVNPWHDTTIDGHFYQGFLDSTQPSYRSNTPPTPSQPEVIFTNESGNVRAGAKMLKTPK